MLKLCFVLLLGVLSAKADFINEIVDEVLYTAKQYAMEYGMDRIKIPDFNETLNQTKVGPWVLTGSIEASQGTVKNTTSIKRVGDAIVLTPGENNLFVSLNVSFEVMEANYDVFVFTLGPTSGDGGLNVVINENLVSISFTAIEDLSGFCNVTINMAQLVNIGGFDIHLLPPGMWNTVKDKVINLYLNHHTDGVVQAVNEHLQNILEIVLDKINPCHYLPFLKKYSSN